MSRVFIGIGSNEGDRLWNISRAMRELNNLSGARFVQMATIIETQPLGGPPQGFYLNTAAELETTHGPLELLAMLKAIEQRMGRQKSALRWAPRTIDLDILLYDDRVIRMPQLVIPHPSLHERRFVLEPLTQLAPGLIHPTLHRPISSLLESLPSIVQP